MMLLWSLRRPKWGKLEKGKLGLDWQISHTICGPMKLTTRRGNTLHFVQQRVEGADADLEAY